MTTMEMDRTPAPWICAQCDDDGEPTPLAVCYECGGVVCRHHYRTEDMDARALCLECIYKITRLAFGPDDFEDYFRRTRQDWPT